MFRFPVLGSVSAVALQLPFLVVADPAGAQSTQLPGVTVQAPNRVRPATVAVAGKRSGAKPVRRTTATPPPAARPPTVQKPSSALGTYNPALDLPDLKLPPGATLTTAGPVDGYRALSAFSSTKTATPIEQIPQSIQVIPKSVITDQNSLSVTEAIQNASNAQGPNYLGIGTTGMSALTIRGFPAQQWLDGLNVNYDSGDRDSLANVERIEILKGPNAILYGGGTGAPTSGAVNIISKLPTDKASVETGVTFGSNSYWRPYFDVNQPITPDKTILFRVTGEYTASDGFVDVVHQNRYSFNPTLTFTDKSDTTLTIQGRLSRIEQQGYEGLPAVGTVAGDFRLKPDLFIGSPGLPKSVTEVQGVTVTFDRQLDQYWSFNVKTRWSTSKADQKSQSTMSAAPDVGPTTWSMANIDLLQRQEEFTINPNLQARFALGPTRNVWLTGVDYSRVTDRGYMYADLGVPPVDLLNNPVFPTRYADPDPASATFFPYFDFNSVYVTKGAYTQLQSTIYDRIHLLAGVRVASIHIDYVENYPFGMGGYSPTPFGSDKTKALPRLGAVVDLIPGLSVYGNYSEGMMATPFTQALNTNIEPETSKQFEGGFKIKVGDHLTGTIAVFDIQRQNIPVTVGVGIGAESAQESKGFETDLIWQPDRNWKVLASYGYTNVVFTDSLNGGIPAGNHPAGVPKNSGRVWVNYAFDSAALRGWSVGAGIYAASSQYVDTYNQYRTPGYFTIDARVGYETEHFRASLNIKNLTGEKYFVPYAWLGGQVAPGDGRAFYGTLAYRY
ncbi:TonB-dependent receptor [Bradyrhizobium sp. U87765 SZCCT0131]|uniref:TonB-dependent siderophore receptor n=1 Tax=unclassified Bradyrhizobium TaxID=2631580 RepID=UPI001BA46BBF|nr:MULTISPECIES: TonB-dependent receptor [unclassified Bradyrhizobium]MBR1219339.1 TonB-dependent receptor [Bradyrhizobium sp. U87765 SZCCT0131]MBR1261990.1 TonB-dependent receptor [Bradyrhizobium sp. U87765 SZCCT0134]MBR1306157.1 TonB-dependent receptor [Bradyrhizobium sp. U87765 SZCCT0110]MBR1317772.1 TonB-dependent receptor [Bradyrhizobium sp. U87765 SZCCT0109]MBR1351474.1 TonB-dependent receptor [Bradyrhizobium sp. U87765 SZCCT0048]